MNTFRTLLAILIMALTLSPNTWAQKTSSSDYNLKKAYDVLKEEQDEDKALGLLREQLKETPDNVEALMLRVRICRNKEDYAQAITDINHAMKVNKPKQSGFAKSALYWWRATVYSEMGNEEKAVSDYKTALELARKDDKESVQDIAFEYGQVLYNLERYDESNVIFRQMIVDDETDQAAMVGLARNLMAQEKCQEALDLLNSAVKFDEDYSQVYRIRLQVYDKMGETDKAIDDGIIYCEKDENALADMVVDVMNKHQNYAVARIKTTLKKTEKVVYWHAMLCELYERNYQYELAIKEYDIIEKEYGKDPWVYANRANCYGELGMTDKAIEEMSLAMAKDPDFYDYCRRGDYYREAARYEEAIADFTSAIEDKPDAGYGYYKRGWCYEMSGDREKAMADYDLGIDIQKDYPYLYLMRGELHQFNGDKEKAAADFEQVLQLDTVVRDGSCRQYALHFLGHDEEAEEWMQKIIDKEPGDFGHYYDKACLYSRMGRLDEAVEAFKKCLEMGYRSFGHIEHDDDLDAIRDLQGFKDALNAAKERLREQLEKYEIENPVIEGKTIEIAMQRHSGGTFEIPCEINGLPLQMIFDTGASDVTISSVEANFMLKNNYLSEKDIKGKKYYQIANGQLSEGTVITLHEVKIGDAVLNNVDASVVKSQKAPLLLGQSAMEKLGLITIDNINSKLIIKQ